MSERMDIFKCPVCDTVVEVLAPCAIELSCCGPAMVRQREKSGCDPGSQEHAPVIERTRSGIKVRFGVVPHPMEADHRIEWVEVIACGKSYRQFLAPGDAPEAAFDILSDVITVRGYCNLHGLWKSSKRALPSMRPDVGASDSYEAAPMNHSAAGA